MRFTSQSSCCLAVVNAQILASISEMLQALSAPSCVAQQVAMPPLLTKMLNCVHGRCLAATDLEYRRCRQGQAVLRSYLPTAHQVGEWCAQAHEWPPLRGGERYAMKVTTCQRGIECDAFSVGSVLRAGDC